METTLHRQLKTLYAAPGDLIEHELGVYRIDVAKRDRLVEVQHSSLNAIRGKIRALLDDHRVTVVKPLVMKKRIVRLNRKGGQVISRRWSPKQGHIAELFDELIYFRELFPNPNLTLEVPLVQIEEWRFQGHGRKRRTRVNDHQVQDQLLLGVDQTIKLCCSADLWQIVPKPSERQFSTQDLAKQWSVPRYRAQKIAYTLQHCQALERIEKSGNAWIYRVARDPSPNLRAVG